MKKESNIDNIIQSLLGKYKVKYEYLDNVINKKIDAVHINIDSIINDYISMNITSKLSSENSNSAIFSITSSILNTAAHYKHYFTKNKTNAIIYLYYYKDKYDLSYIDTVIQLIKTICNFIPGIYMIKSPEKEVRISIKYFCNKHNKNIIISNYKPDITLVDDDICVIRINNKNSHIYYDKQNFYNKILSDDDFSTILSFDLFPIVLSYLGCGEYQKTKSIGKKKFIRYIEKLIESRIIENRYYSDIVDFINDIRISGERLQNIDNETAVSNFYDLNINYLYNKVNQSTLNKLDDYIIIKYADKSIQELNVKYFTGINTLNLDFLLDEYRK